MVGGGWRPTIADEVNSSSNPHFLFKVLLIGDSSVGKSSIIKRFTDDSFQGEFINTIGIDFSIKIMDSPDGSKLKLQIWDTAGLERFRNITTSYYRGTQGIIVVYDSTDSRSFQNIPLWLKEISSYCHDDVPVMLVGNKSDLASQREVSEEEAKTYAIENHLDLVEVSAKDNINIQQVFDALSMKMIEGHKERRKKKLAEGEKQGFMFSKEPENVHQVITVKESQRCGKSKCF